ncbi:hypothetical protein LMH87_009888 [Akanthomyces muscarius]|uniref:Uncharacterized protein n=1 Tax=Akanthomyces muscarius TaxID=2231603 RepID=A0A9W8UMC8_AKAMU|nr:hypothetical protein LMH87_009888 [Akanthomyces muscarius]KAJ4153400.1 hypothetical protein LMH87_009888 [Akanthomyces muscarius]
MDALTIPVKGCSRFPPILYDYPIPYCILAADHPRMEQCCKQVAGSQNNTAEGCYPWCPILPQATATAAAADDNDTAPTTGDTMNSFYMCLVDGDDGAPPEGLSCSSEIQRREASAGSRVAEAGSLRIKMASGLGTLMVVALLYS